jgi:2-dehydro-3-deoxyphosphogluconate aldolase/(4S)-4-hydroxy-2-oxoglutarate aldolase
VIASLPDEILAARLLPLIDHPDPEVVVAAVRAAAAAGAPTVEVALRHPASLDALAEAVAAVAIPVGAGTVVDPGQVVAARDAGAAYLVSPGLSPAVRAAVGEVGLPWLPGAATPTEVLSAREAGATMVKVFPAGLLGGAAYVQALASVVAGMRFVPTGGVTGADAREYLAVAGVVAVGGTWMFPHAGVPGSAGSSLESAVRAALRCTRGA